MVLSCEVRWEFEECGLADSLWPSATSTRRGEHCAREGRTALKPRALAVTVQPLEISTESRPVSAGVCPWRHSPTTGNTASCSRALCLHKPWELWLPLTVPRGHQLGAKRQKIPNSSVSPNCFNRNKTFHTQAARFLFDLKNAQQNVGFEADESYDRAVSIFHETSELMRPCGADNSDSPTPPALVFAYLTPFYLHRASPFSLSLFPSFPGPQGAPVFFASSSAARTTCVKHNTPFSTSARPASNTQPWRPILIQSSRRLPMAPRSTSAW